MLTKRLQLLEAETKLIMERNIKLMFREVNNMTRRLLGLHTNYRNCISLGVNSCWKQSTALQYQNQCKKQLQK